MEPFTLIEETSRPGPHHLFDDVVELSSAKAADHDLPYIATLRENNPDMIVTAVPYNNAPLRIFAAAGFATCERDTDTDSFASWRGYARPAKRADNGQLGEAISFAKYRYRWNNENFILYTVYSVQYILKERREGEDVFGPSRITDQLVLNIGDWMNKLTDLVWVYDGWWSQSYELYREVMKSSWDNVILDESMKKELTSLAHKFFDSKDVYEDLGVPWKRGLLFHGPPGNGKTISIRALMHSLYDRKDPVPTLYVKSAPYTWDIGEVFSFARAQAPCMLVLEDVETIVTPDTRSYFFNEMDGLANNNGLFVVGSTNFLDKLDPGLSKRPSRFDRKYLFPLPNEHERTLYCEFWRNKLKSNNSIDFPEKLCPAMAHITPGFSFAFLQECFVATLLAILQEETSDGSARAFDKDNDDLDDYKLYVMFKKQADVLRKEIGDQKLKQSQLLEWCRSGEADSEPLAHSPQPTGRTSRHCDCCRRDRKGGQRRSITRGMAGMQVRDDELLPQVYPQKSEYINTSALQRKSGDTGRSLGFFPISGFTAAGRVSEPTLGR